MVMALGYIMLSFKCIIANTIPTIYHCRIKIVYTWERLIILSLFSYMSHDTFSLLFLSLKLTLFPSLCYFNGLFGCSLCKPVVSEEDHNLIGVIELSLHESKLPKWDLSANIILSHLKATTNRIVGSRPARNFQCMQAGGRVWA